jgi:signal transduction histidine kinase
MRCSYPQVKFAQSVLLSAFVCCSVSAQAPPAPASASPYSATKAAWVTGPLEQSAYQSSLRALWQDPRLKTVGLSRSRRGDYPTAIVAHAGEEPSLLGNQADCFYITLVVFAAAILIQHYRRRAQSVEAHVAALLEERGRMARDCHDTLMAGFTAISWQLDATAKMFRDAHQESTAAAKSCEIVRTMVSQSEAEARRILCDLRDTAEANGSLSHALARTLRANHLCQSVTTTLNVEGAELPLAPECVHHLVCIGQEAVTNAIRHAEASYVQVQLRYESDCLNLSIQDDGRGFHTSGQGELRLGHFGIRVMEERTNKLGGTFSLRTKVGTGTEIMVRVPVRTVQPSVQKQSRRTRWVRA